MFQEVVLEAKLEERKDMGQTRTFKELCQTRKGNMRRQERFQKVCSNRTTAK
jgi:hypothetical protein